MTFKYNSSTQSFGALAPGKKADLEARIEANRGQSKPPSWWTPVWRGLVADPESKHRKRMGPAIWLFLYLLVYANRKTGIVRRTQESIRLDTGYSIRAIQSYLRRLKKHGYISTGKTGRYLAITVLGWKGFHNREKLWKSGYQQQIDWRRG